MSPELTCDQQIYHVKAVQDSTSQKLDLNRVEDEQFPPEKVRMTIERFYTSVIVGVIEFVRHVGRLRSWREPGRTSAFTLVCYLLLVYCVMVDILTV
jgi:hypothetical protein